MSINLGELNIDTKISAIESDVKMDKGVGGVDIPDIIEERDIVLPDMRKLMASTGKQNKGTYGKKELVQFTKDLGLSQTGNKNEIINRIINEVRKREG